MLASSLFVLALAQGVLGHMQMSWPYPFKSKFNPTNNQATDAVDWSMTNPLGVYPCKGYIDPSAPSVATWSAGSTVNYTITGTAIHGGGSCQISLSYDHGKTWNVIYSHIGGCLIEGLTEDVMIPKDAPGGDALFSWTWFNLLGNREMYQNCAPVTITNGGKGLDDTTYPAPFVANVDVAPGCRTIENIEVVFPNPGSNVKYGGKYAGTVPKPGAGIAGDCAGSGTAPSSGVGGGDAESSTTSALLSPTSLITPSSVKSTPTPSLANNIPSGNANNAAPVLSSSAPSISSASPPVQTGGKKCRRKGSKRDITSRALHARHSHQRLVRRRLSNH